MTSTSIKRHAARQQPLSRCSAANIGVPRWQVYASTAEFLPIALPTKISASPLHGVPRRLCAIRQHFPTAALAGKKHAICRYEARPSVKNPRSAAPAPEYEQRRWRDTRGCRRMKIRPLTPQNPADRETSTITRILANPVTGQRDGGTGSGHNKKREAWPKTAPLSGATMPETPARPKYLLPCSRWLTRPRHITKMARQTVFRTSPFPTSFVTSTTFAGQRWRAAIKI